MNRWFSETVTEWIKEWLSSAQSMKQWTREPIFLHESMRLSNLILQIFFQCFDPPQFFKRGRNHKLFNMSEWFHNTVVSCGSLAPTWRLKPCNKVFCCEATCNCHRFRMVSLNWREPHGTPFPCPGRSYSDFWHRFFNWQVGPTHEW